MYFFFKKFQPLLKSKDLLLQVETKEVLREVTYFVSISANSFLV